MTTAINHEDILDLRDLAELAVEQGDIYSNTEENEEDRETATETLEALISMLRGFGKPIEFVNNELAVEDISDALIRISDDTGGVLINEDYFVDAMQAEAEEFYPEIEDLPSWVFIDWTKTAQALKQDYTEATLDGQTYLINLN